MDMHEMEKQFMEAFPESAKLNEDELELIVGGLRNGLPQDELISRLYGVGITRIDRAKLNLLLDAKSKGGALKSDKRSIT